MPNQLNQLSPQQQTALDALISGASVTEAATRAGVNKATVSKWRSRHTLFRERLHAAQAEADDAHTAALDRLRALYDEAVTVYESALQGRLKSGSPITRAKLDAAKEVLRHRDRDAEVARGVRDAMEQLCDDLLDRLKDEDAWRVLRVLADVSGNEELVADMPEPEPPAPPPPPPPPPPRRPKPRPRTPPSHRLPPPSGRPPCGAAEPPAEPPGSYIDVPVEPQPPSRRLPPPSRNSLEDELPAGLRGPGRNGDIGGLWG